MREVVLRRFFEGAAAPAELASDLVGSLDPRGSGITYHPIVDMQSDFTVRGAHLVRVCDAVLGRQLQPGVLKAIGFCLLASDRFDWDGDDPDGARVAEVAHEWFCPEVNYPLSPKNVGQWRTYLVGGTPKFQEWPRHEKPQLPTVDSKEPVA